MMTAYYVYLLVTTLYLPHRQPLPVQEELYDDVAFTMPPSQLPAPSEAPPPVPTLPPPNRPGEVRIQC